jgi:hypothetical protein
MISWQINQITVPVALAERMETKLISDFSSIHGIWEILLICKYQQHSITQLVLPPKEEKRTLAYTKYKEQELHNTLLLQR